MKKYNMKIWPVIRKIILDHYDEIITERLRDGWYIVREYLNEHYLKQGKISQSDYEHFLKKPSYSYYTQDLWPQLERTGYKRPRAKEIGLVYNLGQELTISQFEEISDRARGFIFVEKAGEADDIKELSNHGWAIIAGQGYSTRLMRELLKEDKRPVLVLHDADTSGDWIYKIFDIGSSRTKHLELWLKNVVDLGLNEKDSNLLELPSQLEAKQYRNKRKMRWELSALTLLKKRLNLENPVLAYTIAKMKQLGVRITPSEIPIKSLLQYETEIRIQVTLGNIVKKLEKILEKIPQYAWDIATELNYPDGQAVTAYLGPRSEKWIFYESNTEILDKVQTEINDELEAIKSKLIIEAQGWVDNPQIIDVDIYEQKTIEKLKAQKIIDMLGGI